MVLMVALTEEEETLISIALPVLETEVAVTLPLPLLLTQEDEKQAQFQQLEVEASQTFLSSLLTILLMKMMRLMSFMRIKIEGMLLLLTTLSKSFSVQVGMHQSLQRMTLASVSDRGKFSVFLDRMELGRAQF
jgi:hypothetical protein